MTYLDNILKLERVLIIPEENCKKRILEIISSLICKGLSNADTQEVFEAFVARERLGNTAIGHGVAIPHIRSDFVTQARGALLYMQQGVNFDDLAQPSQKVDLIFALMVPKDANDEHLKILSELTKRFSQSDFRDTMRKANDNRVLLETILESHVSETLSS